MWFHIFERFPNTYTFFLDRRRRTKLLDTHGNDSYILYLFIQIANSGVCVGGDTLVGQSVMFLCVYHAHHLCLKSL